MKKIILTLVFSAACTFANDTTIDATMQLMNKGMQQIQKGFLYNSKSDIVQGIETIENSNSIFKHVDVSTFIPKNKKITVTKNITTNLEKHLKLFKKAVKEQKFADATALYGKVTNDCLSCHSIIRGW